jgi:hypothetical protein
MTAPTVQAIINFSTGPSFAQAMIFDSGILGTNVLADSAAVIVDVSDQINSIQIKRGRNPQADQFQTGTLSLRIVDQVGDFNPMNTGGPYYGMLNPMVKIQINAVSLNVTYPLYSGFITSFTTTSPSQALDDVVYTMIDAVDAFRLAQMAQITTVSGSASGDLSGTRINQILDEISWPASMRDIDAGQTTVQANPNNAATALGAMQKIELAEYGALYVDATGSFVFQDRAVTAGSVANAPTVFNDDGTGIPYFNAVWRLDDTLIYNNVNVTITGGTAQVATNAASILKYFDHSYNQTNMMMQTDAVALDYALAYCASRAETSVRCDAITLDLYTQNYAAGILAAMELDFFDNVTITTTQPGSSALTKTLQVFGVAYAISPNNFKVTFTTLEPILDSFILDSTLYGILDTSVLSY